MDPLAATALIPFWARVQDAGLPSPLLGDLAAAALAPQVARRCGRLRVDPTTRVGCCLRNLRVDRWLMRLAAAAPIATVVDLGVGLDTRARRLTGIADHYIEVDVAAIIGLRDELMPGTGAVRVAADAMVGGGWASVVPPQPGRLVIVMEGVLTYQSPRSVRALWTFLADRFPDAFVIFDSMSPLQRALANGGPDAGSRPAYVWSTWGTSRLVSRPTRWRIVDEQSLIDRHDLPATGPARWARLAYRLPPLRHSHRLTLAQLPQEKA